MLFTGTLDEVASKAGPSRRLVLEVQKASDSILHALKALSFATVNTNDNTYTLHLKTKDDVRAEISRAVSAAGGVILRMEEEGGGLEDAFMSLVGEEAESTERPAENDLASRIPCISILRVYLEPP